MIRLVSPRRGKKASRFLDWLSKLCREQDELAHFKLQLPQGELNLRDYSWARQLTHDVLDNLLAQMDVERVGNHVLSTFKAQIAKERIVQTLEEFNEIHSDQIGVGKARLNVWLCLQ